MCINIRINIEIPGIWLADENNVRAAIRENESESATKLGFELNLGFKFFSALFFLHLYSNSMEVKNPGLETAERTRLLVFTPRF